LQQIRTFYFSNNTIAHNYLPNDFSVCGSTNRIPAITLTKVNVALYPSIDRANAMYLNRSK